MEAGSLEAAGHGPRTNINATGAPDEQLMKELHGTREQAENAIEFHERELERNRRIARAARAALEQLAPSDKPMSAPGEY